MSVVDNRPQVKNVMDFSQDVDVNVSQQSNGPMNNTNGGSVSDKKGLAPIDERKLFIGGLNFKVSEEELKSHFSQFGNVASINVKCDPITGRFRGFAFVVYTNAESVDNALSANEHMINGRKIEPRRARSRPGKIFVGGLPPELTDDDIKNYFGQYGNITGIDLPFDKEKSQRKNFCFISFDNENVVADLLKRPKQTINGHTVDVKKATPKPDSMYGGIPPAGGMMPGMRNGARGGGPGYMAPQWGAPSAGAYGSYGGGGGGGYGYDSYDYYNGGYEGGYEYAQQAPPAYGSAPYGRPMVGTPSVRGKTGGKMRGGIAGGKPNERNVRHQPY